MMDAHQDTAWPADRVERRAVASLVPYARNSRTHSAEQVDQIAASIREWGWTVPVLVDEEGGLIAGHARVMAAKQLGLAEIPVMVASGWSEAQKRAYVIADNKLALNAGWDEALLRIELTELQALDFDLGITGFSLDEIATLTMDGSAGLTDPDDAPEAPADPVSRLGDVWILGAHRIVCGDATSAADVAPVLNGFTPSPHGLRSALRRRLRSLLACSRRRQPEPGKARQGGQRRPGGLERGMGAIPRRRRVRLARRQVRGGGPGQPRELRL